jgi:hypothetical protein
MKIQGKTEAVYNQLIRDLSRDMVVMTAPEELPLFQGISTAYASNPKQTLQGQKPRDEDLGFGLAEAAILLTPVVLDTMKDVVLFLADEIAKSVKDESAEVVSSGVKKLFKKYALADSSASQTPALTHGQLSQVRQIVLEKARLLALPEEQAGLLADSIVGSLVAAS